MIKGSNKYTGSKSSRSKSSGSKSTGSKYTGSKSSRSKSSRSKSSKSNRCGPGEILKKGYYRKGYQRDKFTRKDGTNVPSSYIPSTRVPPTCIRDVGKPGKGPKTLPKLGDKIHFTKYGYSIYKPEAERRSALRAASKAFNTLEVLRRLNLIRNYQAIPQNKEIFSKDVEYMKKLYANVKKKKSKKSTRNQKGGNVKDDNVRNFFDDSLNVSVEEILEAIGDSSDSPITSDIPVEEISLPENRILEFNMIVNEEKTCHNGECNSYDVIYESHVVNGRQVIFLTLGEKDTDQIFELDKIYLDPNISRNSVLQKIKDNPGRLIGIKIDDKLQGYCQFKFLGNKEVRITWFCANKGFSTALYAFLERYFKLNDYIRIEILVTMVGEYAAKRINFWYDMDYQTSEMLPDKNQILVEKFI